MLEKTTYVNYLFDFYQALLTPKQRNYLEMYYLEDYSLGEISNLSQVSRQAVYDNIRRTEDMLVSYEKKLHLYDKFRQRMKLIDKLEEAVATVENDTIRETIDRLKRLD